ncbi:hypothetical protein [Opitutus sp. ER46]|uniref:hypothetical protein n=1 Tax=Opitutus sp. ER46 TaxID=2161864 RepID=UPI000D31A1DB|nr:hypothetical protein [Opitutus sp. ER46]PTX92624.1 hypothetical protein DB354_14965 [Opitutus sp. ER46]
MSDTSVSSPSAAPKPAARPVSLLVIVFVGVLFAAAFLVARYYYAPTTLAPQNASAENLPPELAWRATAQSRRDEMLALRAAHARKENTYAWIDQQAKVVQLPIQRAMELTVEKYGPRK